MVERKVSFGIDLSPGVSQLRSQLASVTDLSRRAMLQIEQAEERHVQKMMELKKKLQKVDGDGLVSSIAAHRKASEAIEHEESRHQLRMKQMMERGQLSKLEQNNNRFNLSSAGHIAQSMGFYRTGHIFRGLQSMGIGSETGGAGAAMGGAEGGGAAAGGAEAGGAAAGLGAVAAVAIPVVIALGAVMVAAKLVEVGFNTLVGVSESLATTFVGAISQIGGAKNLQEMMVSEAQTAHVARQLSAGAVGREERMPHEALMNRFAKLSEDPSLGAFGKEDWTKAYTEAAKFGFQKTMASGMDKLIAEITHMTPGADLAQTAGVVSNIRAMKGFKEMPEEEFGNAMRNLKGITEALNISMSELPQMRSAFMATSFIGGDRSRALNTATGLAATIRPETGGDVAESSERIKKLFEEGAKHYAGGSFVNKGGQITDVSKFLTTVLGQPGGGFKEVRTREAAQFLQQEAGINVGKDNAAQIKTKVDAMLASFEKMGITTAEWADKIKESTDSTDVLRATFNKVSDALGPGLVKVIDDLLPDIESMGKAISENKDNIVAAIKSLVEAMMAAIPLMFLLADAEAYFVKGLGMAINIVGRMIEEKTMGMMGGDITHFGEKLMTAGSKAVEALDGMEKSFNKAKDEWKNPPPKPDVISGADPKTPASQTASNKIDKSNDHLSHIQTIQERQLQVLHDINKNTKAGMEKPPPAPPRDPGH